MTNHIPEFTLKELMNVGAYFGHKAMRWNPKMAQYIYTKKDNIHIIDLQKTMPLFREALEQIYTVAKSGRILFVGTKKQASDIIAESAKRCGQYYVNHRWLGGMLTNWHTVSASIKTLKELEAKIKAEETLEGPSNLTKKEKLELTREYEKKSLLLGGIKDMGGKPDMLFVIDTNKEATAIREAQKLNIPIVAIVDTNSNPTGITYPIPGNDDSKSAIELYCRLVSEAILNGIQQSLVTSGVDVGAFDLTNEEMFNMTDMPESLEEIKARQLVAKKKELEATAASKRAQKAAPRRPSGSKPQAKDATVKEVDKESE